VSVTIASGSTSVASTVTDNADGSYAIAYTPTVSTNYTTTVSLTIVGGLNAYYYPDDAMALTPTLKVEPSISFDWSSGAPISGFPSDYFSVKFVGKIKPLYSETYTFYTSLGSLDGVRLTIGGSMIINAWDPLNSGSGNEYFL
jgi:hypothetical protein